MIEKRKDVKFVIVGDEFLYCIRFMSPQCPSVWITLLRYWFFKKGNSGERVNEYVFPSKGTLSIRTGLDEETITKCINELKILGFVKRIEQKRAEENQAWRSNYYYLDDHPKLTQAKVNELIAFRNAKRARKPLDPMTFDYELYGDEMESYSTKKSYSD